MNPVIFERSDWAMPYGSVTVVRLPFRRLSAFLAAAGATGAAVHSTGAACHFACEFTSKWMRKSTILLTGWSQNERMLTATVLRGAAFPDGEAPRRIYRYLLAMAV
jgi:hypothetical protein